MQSAGFAGSSLGTQPAAGAAILATANLATDAVEEAGGAVEESDDEEGDGPAQKKQRRSAVGSELTIHVDRLNPMTGFTSRQPTSRYELARSKGLKPSGNNAAIKANIESHFLTALFEHEEIAASKSSGRGASTTDGHVRKVCSYRSVVLVVPIFPRPCLQLAL